MDRFGSDFGAFGDQSDSDNHAANDGHADDDAHSNPPPSPVGQDERRMQVRAYNHWSSLLGRQNLPHIEDLEPEFLGDFGPHSVLLDFSTGSETPTIQFIGSELQKECSEFDPIETLPEIPQGSLLSKIADNYLRVVKEQGPVSFEAECTNAKSVSIAYRGILLPYSSDYDTIDFVYAVINWKEVADAKTADALLEEIDRAMDYGLTDIQPEVEATPAPTADIIHFDSLASARHEVGEVEEPEVVVDESDPWDRDDNVLDLRDSGQDDEEDFYDLPVPNFGEEGEIEDPAEAEICASEESEIADTSEGYGLSPYAPHNEKVDEPMAYDTPEATPETPKRARQTDALGNPIGGAPAEDTAEGSGGITSAADYGLPEWDEEEPEEEDVDELVNPLANIDLNSRLLSLVNSGSRGKKTVDLATLSEAQATGEEEEEAAGFDTSLFRPKAPSVDTLLSPEPYEEEDEFDDVVEFTESAEEIEEFPQEAVTSEEPEVAEYGAPEYAEPDSEYAGAEYTPAEYEEPEMAEEIDSYEPAVAGVEEDYTADEFVEEEASVETETYVAAEEPVEVVAENESEAEPLELENVFVAEEEFVEAQEEIDAEDVLELAEVAEGEPVSEVSQEVAPVAAETTDGLTGLLGAVQELSEAARTTDDQERRALYEAVGRAFDVSIKAVMASGKPQQDVVEHLPLDGVASTGPDMALVMVRRHANGDTEVLGEVPHDTDLMENAQRKLASR